MHSASDCSDTNRETPFNNELNSKRKNSYSRKTESETNQKNPPTDIESVELQKISKARAVKSVVIATYCNEHNDATIDHKKGGFDGCG